LRGVTSSFSPEKAKTIKDDLEVTVKVIVDDE